MVLSVGSGKLPVQSLEEAGNTSDQAALGAIGSLWIFAGVLNDQEILAQRVYICCQSISSLLLSPIVIVVGTWLRGGQGCPMTLSTLPSAGRKSGKGLVAGILL